MIRKGFKMKLYEGMAEEYEKRHNELWPEMQDMIHEHGGKTTPFFLTKRQMFSTAISRLNRRSFGQRAPTRQLTVNGGILWRILWTPTRITVLFRWICTRYFI